MQTPAVALRIRSRAAQRTGELEKCGRFGYSSYVVTIKPDALVAVDRSGYEVWRYPVYMMIGWPSPIVDASGDVIFVAFTEPEEDSWLISLTPDGTEYWHEPLPGMGVSSSLLIDGNGILYTTLRRGVGSLFLSR